MQAHSAIRDLRQQQSVPSIAETLGLEILSWCDLGTYRRTFDWRREAPLRTHCLLRR